MISETSLHGLKLNKKYLVLDESFARYFIVTGGRGSGKSFAVNSVFEFCIWH